MYSKASGKLLTQPAFSDYPFILGVTSGDPASDGFVTWTCLAPNQVSTCWSKTMNSRGFVILKLSVLSAFTGALLSALVTCMTTQLNNTSTEPESSAGRFSIGYSDCLWYVARNHGFYQVQREVANGHSSVQNQQLWQQFVETTGRDECGLLRSDIEELGSALAETLLQADRHFLSQ